MSAGSSGSNDSDRDIDPSLNSVKVANFILLYSFSILCWYLQYQWVFSMLVAYHQYMCILPVSIAPFFCQYCWNVDGLGVAVELLCLRRFICRGVDVVCLCLNTSFVVTNGFPFRLPLVHIYSLWFDPTLYNNNNTRICIVSYLKKLPEGALQHKILDKSSKT